jgi:hypothetical protein
MTAALILPVSGPYQALWDALPLGTQNDDGYEISATFQGEERNETDVYGMTLVEAIYRGMNWKCRFTGVEWNKSGLLSLLQMFGQTGVVGTYTPQLVNIGDRWSKYCQPLLLSAILANPPTMPQSLTALSAGLAPNSQNKSLFTSKLRENPFEMVMLPYASGGSGSAVIPFSTT